MSETSPVILVPIGASEGEAFHCMAAQHFTELNPKFHPDEDWKAHYFKNLIGKPFLFLRWIMVEDRRAGFILFGIESHRFLPRKTGAVYELYITPEFRRRGVARSCALQAIEELHRHGPTKIQLEVMDGNFGAEALWRSLGFRKASERFVLANDPRVKC